MKDYAAIALDVRCDVCNAPPGLGCLRRDGTGRLEPHPSRVNEARLAAIGKPKEPDAKWLELAEIWSAASEADQRAILAVVKLRQALPHGIDAMVRVLEHGASKHNGGKLGSAPGWTASQHAEHLLDHAQAAMVDPASRDRETGELDAAHAGARAVLEAQLVESVERGQVW